MHSICLGTPKEIAVIGAPQARPTRELRREVWNTYIPNKVVAFARPDDEQAQVLVPLLRDRSSANSLPTAYVCEHYACKEPVTEPHELRLQLVESSHSASQSDAKPASGQVR